MAQFHADFVWIDWQHASCNVESMTNVRMVPFQHLLLVMTFQIDRGVDRSYHLILQ